MTESSVAEGQTSALVIGTHCGVIGADSPGVGSVRTALSLSTTESFGLRS